MKAIKAVGIERAVCEDIAARQQMGIKKYGTTVAENKAHRYERLQHAYQESLDLAIYLKWEMSKLCPRCGCDLKDGLCPNHGCET